MQNLDHTIETKVNYPFLQELEAVKVALDARESAKFANDQTKDYAMVEANLQTFLPELPMEKARAVYMNIHYNRTMMLVESKQRLSGDWLNCNHPEVLRDGQPKVYCTYHLGPYRAPIALLIKEQVDFVLLLDNRTITRQGEEISQQIAAIKQQYGSNARVELLNVEKTNVMYKVLEFTRQGYSVLAYIDGNTGGGGVYKRDEKFQTPVRFLGSTIMARSGLAAIAYLAKLSLHTIIAYRPDAIKAAPPRIDIGPAYKSDRKIALKPYIAQTTQALYTELASYMNRYYDQWEPWFYVHKYLPGEALEASEDAATTKTATPALSYASLKFNRQRYNLFKIESDCYLMDKQQYLFHPLEEEMYAQLKRLVQQQDQGRVSGRLRWLSGLKFMVNPPKIKAKDMKVLQAQNVLCYG